jgi:sialate O-acetylesterase
MALRTSDGKAPRAFAIAGADGKFAWANAEIDGESVVLTSPAVPAPKFVRYAWSNNPLVNLINSEGLPAVPFRTDKKPYTTANNN